MKKLMTIAITGLFLVFVGPTLANDTVGPIGDPIAGNSWSQGFYINPGYYGATTNLFAVKLYGPWSEQYFESPTLTGFSSPGWSLAYENPGADKWLAIATGSPTDYLGFTSNFAGTTGQEVAFDGAVFSGDTMVFGFVARWHEEEIYHPGTGYWVPDFFGGGSHWVVIQPGYYEYIWNWDFENSDYWQPTRAQLDALIPQAIPAPGAMLLGSIGAGFVGWLRRRRTL